MQKTVVEEAKEMLTQQGIDESLSGYSEILAATITAVANDRSAWVQRDGFVKVAEAITAIMTTPRH